MCKQCDRTTPATADLSGQGQGPVGGTSRRSFLKSSAALATGGAAAQALSSDAFAQGAGAADGELARMQGERRILLKGGVVLTLDRQVGDFAQADVLIEGARSARFGRTSRYRAMRSRSSTPRTELSFPASSTPTAIPTRGSCATSW